MRNPPWIVPIVAPLGFLSFGVAQRLWLIGGLFAILISLKWLWELYRVAGQTGLLTSLAIATFSPIAVALTIGQISPLILLGIAGFLRFEKKGRLGLAGIFLVLAALKPHLLFLLWGALLLWSICNRSVKILGMFASTIVTSSFIAVLFDHSIFAEYAHLVTREGVLHELTPTVGGVLRLSLRTYVLQLLPAMIALGWFLFYAWGKIRQSQWRWSEETPLLLVVSLLTTPYSWLFDQVLLIPCIFLGISRLATVRHRRVTRTITGLYLGANVLVLVLILLHRSGFWYTWTIPVWFTLFTLASLQQGGEPAEAPAGAPGS